MQETICCPPGQHHRSSTDVNINNLLEIVIQSERPDALSELQAKFLTKMGGKIKRGLLNDVSDNYLQSKARRKRNVFRICLKQLTV